jgi:hypothetical protein
VAHAPVELQLLHQRSMSIHIRELRIPFKQSTDVFQGSSRRHRD